MDLHDTAGDVAIGRPTPNNSVYILDEYLRPVPLGQAGMMWAGGLGVSLGYLNRPELSKQRFKPDPYRLRQGYVPTVIIVKIPFILYGQGINV